MNYEEQVITAFEAFMISLFKLSICNIDVKQNISSIYEMIRDKIS
jgi:hypothetical protein